MGVYRLQAVGRLVRAWLESEVRSGQSVQSTRASVLRAFVRRSTTCQLPDDEAQHLARVLRLQPGDSVAVFDGQGREAVARVESVAPRRVSVQVIEPRSPAPEPRVARDAGAGAAEERQDGSRHPRCRHAGRVRPFSRS